MNPSMRISRKQGVRIGLQLHFLGGFVRFHSLLRSPLLLFAIVVSFGIPVHAQDPPDVAVGMSPTTTYQGGDFDSVDMVTGRLQIHIPLVIDHSQRGKLNFTYSLSYTSTGVWAVVSNGRSLLIEPPKYGVAAPAVIREGAQPSGYHQTYHDSSDGYTANAWSVYEDGAGAGPLHPMGTTGTTMESIDGSGFQYLPSSGTIINNAGIRFGLNGSTSVVEDPNGNEMTEPYSLYAPILTDTLGRPWQTVYCNSNCNVTGCPTGNGVVAPTLTTTWTIPGPSGGTRTFKFCYSVYQVQTNFNTNFGTQYTGTGGGMTGIVLPDGTTWEFIYDNSYSDLTAVYPPTGGHISYTWTTVTDSCPGNYYGAWDRIVASRTIFDGVNSNTWNYADTTLGTTFTVTDPLGNDTVYSGDSCTGQVTSVQSYAGTGNARTIIKTVAKGFLSLPNPYPDDLQESWCSNSCLYPTLLNSVTTTWPNGQQSQELMTYDSALPFTDTNPNHASGGNGGSYISSYGLVIADSHSDYGNGNPGPVLSTTSTNYWALSRSNYITANILNLPSSVITTNVNSYQCSETDYTYDVAAQIVSSGVTEQHVSAPSPGVLGDMTSVTQQLYGNSCQSATPTKTPLTTNKYVYDTGMLQKSVDPLTNPTTYSYSGTNYGAYPTTVCNALNQCTDYVYDFNTGLMTSMADPNDQVDGTHWSWTWDCMLRLIQENYPDGGEDSVTFNYSPSSGGCGSDVTSSFVSATETKKMSSTQNYETTQIFDGLGRLKEEQLNSDPSGTTYTDITYDGDGRKYKVWNPTRCTPPQTNNCETTWGYTTYNYDPLNRVLSVVEQDGSTVTTAYAGNTSTNPPTYCTTVTDEAGKQRESCVDGMGRLTSVLEDPGPSPHLNYLTSYTQYDALNDLLSMTQNGSRQRSFTYDSLSRLIQASNPESGSISYTYDADSNLFTKTDARSTVITYCYDQLNRLTGKRYAVATCPLSTYDYAYFYDSLSTWGYPSIDTIGRLVAETNGSTTYSFYNYHPLGQPYRSVICLPTNCNSTTGPYFMESDYDLAGDLTTLIYPSVRQVNYSYNAAMQPTQVQLYSFNGTQIGYNYLSSASYAPTGGPTSVTLGSGVKESTIYNDRVQFCNLQIATGTFTWLNRTNNYYSTPGNNCQPGTGGNNGNVWSIIDNIQSNNTQSFGYDNVNRLASAQTQGTSGPNCWGQSYNYDAWANLLSATATLSGCPMMQLSVTVNSQNQITNTGIQYDQAGNMLKDGVNTYTYDAEDRISTVNSTAATYTYDAEGRRTQKQTGSGTTEYVYFNGQPIAEYNTSGVWNDYIFDGSRRLAMANGTDEWSVTNGSFEQALTGWSTYMNVTLETNAANAHSGSNYVQISASPGNASIIEDTSDMAVQAGDQITFGGWVNLQSGGGGALGWWLVVYNSSQTAIAYVGTPTPTSSGWTYQSATYTVPTGAAYVLLYAQVDQPTTSTTIWVDDAFISTGIVYYHEDHLGSARFTSDSGGNVMWSATYLPFGQEWNPQLTTNHYKFTGKERDSESGLDNFGARYDSSQYGRFMSPDPSNAGADPGNPQSWNMYSYVLNNPLNAIDPDGRTCVHDSDTGDYHDNNDGGPTCADADKPSNNNVSSSNTTAQADNYDTTGSYASTSTSSNAGGPTGPLPLGTGGQSQLLSLMQPQSQNNAATKTCSGDARVLQGNAKLIGKPGGFSTPSKNVPVTAKGAAVIPRQWGGASALRPNLDQISGTFPNANTSFQGVVDTIGSTQIPNVQDYLMQEYPGKTIIELPGSPRDLGVTQGIFTVPATMSCPAGTTQVP